MVKATYSQLNSILIDDQNEPAHKIGKFCLALGVHDLSEAKWPIPVTDLEIDVKRRIDMFIAETVIDMAQEGISEGEISKRIDHAFFVISSYITDRRLITPLVILWAAGRMSRHGMEPGLCFTQILHYMYQGEGVDKHKYDLKYAFRDKDVLASLKAVQDADLIDPVVKQDFLLSMKQILTYLRNNDRDFRKGLTLTQVEKMI